MKITKLNLIRFLFVTYLVIIMTSNVSLVGYWTDFIFCALIIVLISILTIHKRIGKVSLVSIVFVCLTAFLTSIVLLGVFLISPFGWDKHKMIGFYYQSVDNRVFHAYFKPVGSYSGGQGNFWITESPKFFPVIEFEKYYDRTVEWDFRTDNWEGEPVNQKSIVKSYIKREVINSK